MNFKNLSMISVKIYIEYFGNGKCLTTDIVSIYFNMVIFTKMDL